jgi:3',5'-cyclic AMP phosphodiesterase CpdA
MKKIFFLFLTMLVIFSCTSANNSSGSNTPQTSSVTSANFAVFSDSHLYDKTTLGDNSALDTYLSEDRKMLRESSEILDTVINDLKTQSLDFVLVPGDITKDGEKVDHQLFATKMTALRNAGIKVYVIPGNHDINNPHAVSYANTNGTTTPVTQVTPEDFKSIYADFGYGAALYQDPNSLTYIVEPVSGIWIFAIDSCIYSNNIANGTPTTAGQISDASLAWIISKLKEAKQKGKIAVGMEHHGIVEHFTGQSALFSEYVLTDYASVGKQLSDNGLNVMFTGHFHANDITAGDFTSSKIYDIETGSLVTSPSPYRKINLNIPDKTFTITTKTVQAIASHPGDFVSYAHNFLIPELTNEATAMLAPYKLDAATSSVITPLLVHGIAAHYAGDENMSTYDLDPTVTSSVLTTYYNTFKSAASGSASAQMLLGYIDAIWTDKAPADNTVTITLN